MNMSMTAAPLLAGSEMVQDPKGSRAWLAPALASVLCVVLGAPTITALSATMDEATYISLGVKSWYGDHDRLVSMGALPLFSWAQNAAGAMYVKAKFNGLPSGSGTDIEMDTESQLILVRLARWTNLLVFGLGAVWSVWYAALRWFGPRVAGAAALFSAVEPNLLAGYVLATADAPCVPFALLSVVAFDSYLRAPTSRRLLQVASLIGLGIALKVSMLPIGLLLMGSCLVARALASSGSAQVAARRLAKMLPRFLLVELPAIITVALALSWVANGFLMGRALAPGSANKVAYKLFATLGYTKGDQSVKVARFQSLMVPAPLSVFRYQMSHSSSGHGMMFRGRVAMFGPWYYYPYVFTLKTHLVMLAMGFLGLMRRDVWKSPFPLAAALLVAMSCSTKLHGGPRYFLILYALWALLAGAGSWGVLDLLRQGLSRNMVAAGFATASLALTLLSAPDYLTHTSLLWGGDWESYRFADANFDWGQGTFSALSAADKKGLCPVAFFLSSSPSFGCPRDHEIITGRYFEYTDELPPRLQLVEETLGQMRGRFVAVPLRYLYGPLPHEAVVPIFRALRATPPAGRLTKLYVYYDLRSPEQFAALEGAVRREIHCWVQEWEAGRRAGRIDMGPFSADPRAL
jgi:hypothetical protein